MEKKTIDQIIEIDPKIKDIFDTVLLKRKMHKSNWKLYLSLKKKVNAIFLKNQDLLNYSDYNTVNETLLIALYL